MYRLAVASYGDGFFGAGRLDVVEVRVHVEIDHEPPAGKRLRTSISQFTKVDMRHSCGSCGRGLPVWGVGEPPHAAHPSAPCPARQSGRMVGPKSIFPSWRTACFSIRRVGRGLRDGFERVANDRGVLIGGNGVEINARRGIEVSRYVPRYGVV